MSIPLDPMQYEPLTVLEELEAQDVAFLDDRIYKFNAARTGITDGRLLVFVLRDAHNKIYAGHL